MVKREKLREEERDMIALLKSQGCSVREIGRRLSREHSSILREIKRNRFGENYVAIHAQNVSNERKSAAGKRTPLKDKQTYSYVVEKLGQGWSPEQIAGRIALESGKHILCHETIYRFVYSKGAKEQNLWEYLPRKQRHRKKQHGRSSQKVHIPQRVSIHLRPTVIDQRQEVGHWEGDTVEGLGRKGGIHTEVERVSRFLLAAKIPAITSAETVKAQLILFETIPKEAKLSTTLDNGKENHLHTVLNSIGIRTYFADPYSSWQRGTNENTNGLLRRYLPKKTSFQTLTQEELDDIVWEINNRPRKVLDYKTATEILGGAFQLRM
jgi:transposase, IS30 family